MNTLAKVLLGTTIVAAAGAVVAAVAVKENKKEEQKPEEAPKAKVVVMTKDDKSVLGRIKRFVTKKVVKFLAWVALHMEQIEAASVVVGLALGAISIAGAIRDYKAGSDLEMKMDKLQEDMNLVRYYQDHDAEAINHNNKVFATTLEHICSATNVDAKELEKDLKECDPGFWDNTDLINTLEAIEKDYKTKKTA